MFSNMNLQKDFVLFRYPQENPKILIDSTGDDIFRFVGFSQEEEIILRGNSKPISPEFSLVDSTLVDKEVYIMDKTEYTDAFDNYKKALETNVISKAILSRVIHYPIKSLNILSTFHKLCKENPTALVYAANLGSSGIWLGASPEKLLSYKNGIARTIALAGTKLTDDPSAWGIKEKEEHLAVEEYIASLSGKTFKMIEKSPVYFAKAGNVYHLKSDFLFEINSSNINSFLLALHPTPAVCGVPLEKSKQLILEQEKHNRELYTGYLGIQKAENENILDLFVNLRCMQITSNGAYIYVGGGITKDSICQDEWNETEAKARTMLNVLI